MTSISPLRPEGDLAGDLEAVLTAQAVRHGFVPYDDLHHPARLAEVEERHPAVVPPASDPAGQGHGLSDVVGAQGAGVVASDHDVSSSVETMTRGVRSSSGGVQVAGSAPTCSPLRMSFTSCPSSPGNQTKGMPRRSA